MSKIQKVIHCECYKYPTVLNPYKYTLDSECFKAIYESGYIATFTNRICLPKGVKKFLVGRTRIAQKSYGTKYMIITNIYK